MRNACWLVLCWVWLAPAHAVECAHREFNGLGHVVCRVARSEKLTLYHRDDRGAAYASIPALRAALTKRGLTLTFAMNAGMFHPDQTPVGLLVIDGGEIAPLNRATAFGNFYLQPNGVFLVDASGPRVLATQDYQDLKPRLATQSGPMLLAHGNIPDIAAFNPASRSRHVRNGVCVPEAGVAAFVISDQPVTFHEFALFFRDALHCQDALYLDGSISSLYAESLGREDHGARLGPMFAVTR